MEKHSKIRECLNSTDSKSDKHKIIEMTKSKYRESLNNTSILQKQTTNNKIFKFSLAVDDMTKYYGKEDTVFIKKQFFEALSVHLLYFLFGPFIVPFLMLFNGKSFVINLGFWGTKLLKYHLLQLFYFLTLVITTILSILILLKGDAGKDNDYKNQYIFLTPSYISQVYILIQYVNVSVKYGFFPRKYYNLWKTSLITRTEINSNYIYEGWINPSILSLDCYLKENLQRQEIDINNFNIQCIGKVLENFPMKLSLSELQLKKEISHIRNSFLNTIKRSDNFNNILNEVLKHYEIGKQALNNNIKSEISNPKDDKVISKPKQKFQNFIRNKILPLIRKHTEFDFTGSQIIVKTDNIYEINGVNLLRLILNESKLSISYDRNQILNQYLSTIMNCIICLSCTILYSKFMLGAKFECNTLSIINLLFSSGCFLIIKFMNQENLIYGILDFRRKQNLMEICSSLIDFSDFSDENRKYPLINIFDYNSLKNWYSIRKLLSQYGRRFSQRIIIQTSIICFLSIIGGIIVVLSCFNVLSTNYIMVC